MSALASEAQPEQLEAAGNLASLATLRANPDVAGHIVVGELSRPPTRANEAGRDDLQVERSALQHPLGHARSRNGKGCRQLFTVHSGTRSRAHLHHAPATGALYTVGDKLLCERKLVHDRRLGRRPGEPAHKLSLGPEHL